MKRFSITLLLLAFMLLSACGCKHTFSAATCTEPETCTACGEKNGEALGHDWLAATCTTPERCSRCGAEQGKALGHTPGEWTVTQEATCSAPGEEQTTCTVCGDTYTQPIEPVAHTPGDWVVTTPATLSQDGVKTRSCSVCGAELETEAVTLSEEEKKALFQESCQSYSYQEIARNPDQFIGTAVKFTGEVIQVIESGDTYTLRVNVTQGKYVWSDTILVSYTRHDSSESRILEDDIITLYGYCLGTMTYETVLGASVTIPAVDAQYITFSS